MSGVASRKHEEDAQFPSHRSSSPIKAVDPVVRALNTIMFGLLVHFGTIMSLSDTEIISSAQETLENWQLMVLKVLLMHEFWVYWQHFNVLANPHCQRLDRQYGIALLRKNEHWAIAGTLAGYWCRETLGMFACLPFLTLVAENHNDNTTFWISTEYLLWYSIIYHSIKSRGVRRDAAARDSSSLGIMRIVIDHFFWDSSKESLLTISRLFLQGLDTYIHYQLIHDLTQIARVHDCMPSYDAFPWLAIWVGHAALNQYFSCSTASVMVQAWHKLTKRNFSEKERLSAGNRHSQSQAVSAPSKSVLDAQVDVSDTDSESSQSSFGSCEKEKSVVRELLRPGRVSPALCGRRGAASNGVDLAVRLETAAAISTLLFGLLGDTPLRILVVPFTIPSNTTELRKSSSSLQLRHFMYAWQLICLLFGVQRLFLSSKTARQGNGDPRSSCKRTRLRSIINSIDVTALAVLATMGKEPPKSVLLSTEWVLAMILAFKTFLRSSASRRTSIISSAALILEFFGRIVLCRSLANIPEFLTAGIGSAVCLVWFSWVVSSPVLTPCEVSLKNFEGIREQAPDQNAADAVFLGHPAELSDCWALWLTPYSLEDRFQCPWWAAPLWPLHYLVGWYVCNFRRRIFGNRASFFCCDDVNYSGLPPLRTRMQTWTAAHFGRHFVTNAREVRCNIVAAAQHAELTGVKVLCLGALNKAESINAGGLGVVQALGPKRKLSIIHGNHLTAAAVVETVHRCFGEKAKVFLTGASSKVGWAVAQALQDRFDYDILCHSTDPNRRARCEKRGLRSTGNISDGTLFTKLWIVGKYDVDVASLIPRNATAIVFSVPHPLQSRSDVRIVEAGMLHIDLSRLDRPRQFSNKLREHEVFACHAASLVAVHRLRRDKVPRIDEVGAVDPATMDSWLSDAKDIGLRIPRAESVNLGHLSVSTHDVRPPIIIVGAGPAGLATAAALAQRNIYSILVDSQAKMDAFGSWASHFTGLEVTTQKRWCNLPFFPMLEQDFPGDYVSASDYRRYLKLYAHRFGLEIRRGVQVKSVEKGDETSPWLVHCDDGDATIAASGVVIATGKHRTPQRNTSDNLATQLIDAKLPFLHSTDLKDERTWSRAIDSARAGRLCIVGFGNSAADLCSAILKDIDCPGSEESKNNSSKIHIAARTIPPVFPRQKYFFRVDALGSLVRRLPRFLQELAIRALWSSIPSSRQCDVAFPSHLRRWDRVADRVPVIDKFGSLAWGLGPEGPLVGHGPVTQVTALSKGRAALRFQDSEHGGPAASDPVEIDLVILATGYQKADGLVGREDPLNGLFRCGFGSDRLLPLKSIGEEALRIAKEIESLYQLRVDFSTNM